jgi:hypothetical protein
MNRIWYQVVRSVACRRVLTNIVRVLLIVCLWSNIEKYVAVVILNDFVAVVDIKRGARSCSFFVCVSSTVQIVHIVDGYGTVLCTCCMPEIL